MTLDSICSKSICRAKQMTASPLRGCTHAEPCLRDGMALGELYSNWTRDSVHSEQGTRDWERPRSALKGVENIYLEGNKVQWRTKNSLEYLQAAWGMWSRGIGQNKGKKVEDTCQSFLSLSANFVIIAAEMPSGDTLALDWWKPILAHHES